MRDQLESQYEEQLESQFERQYEEQLENQFESQYEEQLEEQLFGGTILRETHGPPELSARLHWND